MGEKHKELFESTDVSQGLKNFASTFADSVGPNLQRADGPITDACETFAELLLQEIVPDGLLTKSTVPKVDIAGSFLPHLALTTFGVMKALVEFTLHLRP